MSCIISAAGRRRVLLASSFLVPLLSLGNSGAHAQQTASSEQLPPIEVSAPTDANRTRARPIYDEGAGARRVAPNPVPSNNPAPGTGANVGSQGGGQGGGGTPIRQFAGIVGASATVLTPAENAHSAAAPAPHIM